MKHHRWLKSFKKYLKVILLLFTFSACFGQKTLINPILKSCTKASNPAVCTQNTLYEYISKNIQYPTIARNNDAEGIVRVSFIITQTGQITGFKVESCFGFDSCDKQFYENAFKDLKWEIGKRNGIPVSFQVLNYTIFLDLEPVNHTPPPVNIIYFRNKVGKIKIGSNKEKKIEEAQKILPPQPKKDITIYKEVDLIPIFPGCQDGGPFRDSLKSNDCSQMVLNAFIQKRLIYPKNDFAKGIEGIVQVNYVIEKDGTLSNFEIVKGLSKNCNQAAKDALHQMNIENIKWQPSFSKGKTVRSQQTVHIRFSISAERARREKRNW